MSVAHKNEPTTKAVHNGDSADLRNVPQAEKKAAGKACLCCKLHICVCSPTKQGFVFFKPLLSYHGEKMVKSQTAGASVTVAKTKLKSTIIGGTNTNFLVDLMNNNKKKEKTPPNERCASAVGIHFAHSSCTLDRHKKAMLNEREYVLLSRIIDRSTNNLPLFLLDMNVCCKCQKLPFNVLVAIKHRKRCVMETQPNNRLHWMQRLKQISLAP